MTPTALHGRFAPPGARSGNRTTPSNTRLRYEIGLVGHLDDHWLTWFRDLAVTHESDGTTTLRGPVVDQAGLHGLLAKVGDPCATLISLVEASRW